VIMRIHDVLQCTKLFLTLSNLSSFFIIACIFGLLGNSDSFMGLTTLKSLGSIDFIRTIYLYTLKYSK
jgi:hypothetical protein